MTRIETRTLLLAAVALATATASHAQNTFITTDRTVANGNPYTTTTTGTVYVGTTTTNGSALVPDVDVDIVAPASALSVNTYSTSQVSMSGGSIQAFRTFGDSHLTVSGGTIGSSVGYTMNTNDRSRLTVTGGNFVSSFGLTGDSFGEILGGTFRGSVTGNGSTINASNNSRLIIRDGMMNAIGANDNAVVDVYGGTFRYSTVPSTQSGSPVPVSSGVGRGGTLNIFGGDFDAQMLSVTNNSGQTGSTVNIAGGSHGRLQAFNAGVFNVSGGVFNNSLICSFGSTTSPYGMYNFVGTGFSLTNARAFTLTDEYVNGFTGTMYDLRGTLADGNAVVSRYFVQNQTVAQGASQGVNGITFSSPAVVPEYSTLALFVLPLFGAVVRRQLFAMKGN